MMRARCIGNKARGRANDIICEDVKIFERLDRNLYLESHLDVISASAAMGGQNIPTGLHFSATVVPNASSRVNQVRLLLGARPNGLTAENNRNGDAYGQCVSS